MVKLDGFVNAFSFPGAVVVGHNGDHTAVETENGHKDDALEFVVNAEYRNCRGGKAHKDQVHAVVHHGTDGLHDNGRYTNFINLLNNAVKFTESGYVTLYHRTDVKEGYTPCVGVKETETGEYCWVLDGEWLLDDIFNRIPVLSTQESTDLVPRVKIESDYWYVSVDGSQTWQQLKQSTAGEESYSFFQKIDINDKQQVSLIFNDGTCIVLPKQQDSSEQESCTCPDPYDPWDGYLDPDVYQEQDII